MRNLPRPLTQAELMEVQEFLRDSKDYKMSVDGIYGPGTRQALLNFERRHEILVTGRPTPELLAAIRASKKITQLAREQLVAYLIQESKLSFSAFALDNVDFLLIL